MNTNTFKWLVKREFWEHRGGFLWAPVVVAGIATVFSLVASIAGGMAVREHRDEMTFGPGAAAEHAAQMGGLGDFALTGGMMMMLLVCALVVFFFALGSLYDDRRDRSILFWKSLPVSDGMTVLSKAAVPLVVVPLIVFPIVVVSTLTMMGLQSLVWSLDGFDARQLWARVDLPFLWLALLYGLPFMALWNAPVYAWILLASAWSRRLAFLWAAAPFAAMLMVEHLALHHTPAHWLLERRIGGGVLQPWSANGEGTVWAERLSDLDPARIWSLPGLWAGVLLAGVFLYGATRIRRSRTPN